MGDDGRDVPLRVVHVSSPTRLAYYQGEVDRGHAAGAQLALEPIPI